MGKSDETGDEKFDPVRFLVRGSCGAFLAALVAVSVHFWWMDINWWFVGGCALFGFFLAGFWGDEAIAFLKEVLDFAATWLWWWW
jgi:hypothetical protein